MSYSWLLMSYSVDGLFSYSAIQLDLNLKRVLIGFEQLWIMMFNATFNNISVITWRSEKLHMSVYDMVSLKVDHSR